MAFEPEGVFDRYLRKVASQLQLVEPGRREGVLAELRSHLTEAAEAEGRSPDEPAFQAALVARLGPARRVGRELAVSNGAEPPVPLWLRALGGLGVLLSPLMLIIAFSTRDEELGEFLIFGSQMPFVLAVPVVYQICRHTWPRLSLLHLLLGLLAGIPLPLSVVLSSIDPQITIAPPLPQAAIFIWLALSGVWVALAGVFAVLRSGRLSTYASERDRFLGAGVLGLLAGPTWVVMLGAATAGGLSSGSSPLIRSLALFTFFGWMLLNVLWSVALAAGLLLPMRWLADSDTPVSESHRPRLH